MNNKMEENTEERKGEGGYEWNEEGKRNDIHACCRRTRRKREACVIWLKMDLLFIETRWTRCRSRIACHMSRGTGNKEGDGRKKNRWNYNGICFLTFQTR